MSLSTSTSTSSTSSSSSISRKTTKEEKSLSIDSSSESKDESSIFRQSLWYYLDQESNKTIGVFSIDDLKDMYDENEINEDTMVCEQEENASVKEKWKKIADIPQLRDYLKKPLEEMVLESALHEFDREIGQAEKELIHTLPDEHIAVDVPSMESKTITHSNDMDSDGMIVSQKEKGPKQSSDALTLQSNHVQSLQYTYTPELPTDKYEDESKGYHGEQIVGKKRKREAPSKTEKESLSSARKSAIEREEKKIKDKQNAQWDSSKNTSIYITGLPPDITLEEFKEYFSKVGLFKEDPITGEEKVKLYRDKESGKLKGDGLIVFFRKESIELAITLYDQTEIRPGYKITIQQAEFKPKDPSDAEQARKRSVHVPKKSRQAKKLQWGFTDEKDSSSLSSQRIVILKNMFSPDDFLTDPMFGADLKEDIKSECEKLGIVEKVKVFVNHPEGVVSVKFKSPESAEKCIKVMNGRFFAKKQISAEFYDGKTDYNVHESIEDEQRRLEEFSKRK